MADITCLYQAEQLTKPQLANLADMLGKISENHLATESNIVWLPIAKGSGFTAGKSSSSSLVSIAVPDGYAATSREKLLGDICAGWQEITGCSVNEIVASAIDQSRAKLF